MSVSYFYAFPTEITEYFSFKYLDKQSKASFVVANKEICEIISNKILRDFQYLTQRVCSCIFLC